MKYLLQANKKYGWLNRNPIMMAISRMLISPAEVLIIYGKSANRIARKNEVNIRAAGWEIPGGLGGGTWGETSALQNATPQTAIFSRGN